MKSDAKSSCNKSDERWTENLDAEFSKLVGGNLLDGGELSGRCQFFNRYLI